jgi:hypothetical protein
MFHDLGSANNFIIGHPLNFCQVSNRAALYATQRSLVQIQPLELTELFALFRSGRVFERFPRATPGSCDAVCCVPHKFLQNGMPNPQRIAACGANAGFRTHVRIDLHLLDLYNSCVRDEGVNLLEETARKFRRGKLNA